MTGLDLVASNLLSPMVLAFALGFIAVLVKSDLKLPEGLYVSLSIYLLFAIGLKGGVALSRSNLQELSGPFLATLVLGIVTPLLAYFIARKFGKLDRADASAMAAHYGSVSAVTFIAATSFAQSQGLAYEGFMPALVAVLEIPAILVALSMALKDGSKGGLKLVLRELVTGRAVILLVGGVAIGLLAGTERMVQVEPLFGDLFKGALTIFLLEMGLVAGARAGDLKGRALFLLGYGILVPLINGLLGVWAGSLVGMTAGGAGILGAMAASASYIAAPAAVRIVLPQANPGLYLTGSLTVTFPFNLMVGVPLYLEIAHRLIGK